MSVHGKTPILSVNDPRGLSIRTVGYWRSRPEGPAQTCVNYTRHDAAGRSVAQWDPRLWALQVNDPQVPANLTTVYSLTDQVLRSDSVDAGMQIGLHGVGAQKLFEWDSRGTRREVHYDPLLRPVAVFEAGASQPSRCSERMEYGQPGTSAPTLNQLGQLIRHDDLAGSMLFETFAISGQCTENTRHFTLDLVTPDWPEQIDQRTRLLEPGDGATSRWRFGPLAHVLEKVDARGNRQGCMLTLDGRPRANYLQLRNQSAARTLFSDIRYNADGKVTQEVAGNGVRTTLTYCPEDGRLQARHAAKINGDFLQHLIYDYDPMGNVLSIEDKAMPVRYFANQRIEPVSRFTYDSFSQLNDATGWEAGAASQGPASLGRVDPAAISNYRQTYRYDASGNLLELIHVGARNGRKLKAARFSNRCLPYRDDVPPSEEAIAAAFDPSGNLRELEAGRSLTWNLRNQLHSVTPVGRASGRNDVEQYFYDAVRLRVRKTRSFQTNTRGLVADVRYLSGLELRSNTGTEEQMQVIIADGGLNSVRVLHWESAPPSGSNDIYRYSFTDHLGSNTLELGEDAGIISQEAFYPFGETAWSRTVEVSYRTVRFSGKERDVTGLYYYGFRYYIPWLQRWLNPDPAGAVDGLNLYRMVSNNPATLIDLDGLAPVAPPPPPPLGLGVHSLLPEKASLQSPPKKWVIKEDPALYKQQGGEYPYYSSFAIALQKLNIGHYNSIGDMDQFVNVWREVGQKMTPPARNIDHEKALEVQAGLMKIDTEWSGYHRADVMEVFRGDSMAILSSYPWLAQFVKEVGDGATEKTMSLDVRSQLIMSTAKDPTMGYVSGKSIMWHFELESGHAGVSEGLYASEGEVTFPIYNNIQIASLQRIPEGKSYMDNAERYGTAHKYVIRARMLPRSVSRKEI